MLIKFLKVYVKVLSCWAFFEDSVFHYFRTVHFVGEKICKLPDSLIPKPWYNILCVKGLSSSQAARFSNPVTAYNLEFNSLDCKHQKFEDKYQYGGEICYGLELFIIKEIMCSWPDGSVGLWTDIGWSHGQAVSVRIYKCFCN
jgi:hypothetical protein